MAMEGASFKHRLLGVFSLALLVTFCRASLQAAGPPRLGQRYSHPDPYRNASSYGYGGYYPGDPHGRSSYWLADPRLKHGQVSHFHDSGVSI